MPLYPKSHITPSGRFQVVRDGVCLKLIHVATGLPCGSFSHLAVRTFKQALEGVAEAERLVGERDMALVGDPRADHTRRQNALENLVWALRTQFPNGAWAR